MQERILHPRSLKKLTKTSSNQRSTHLEIDSTWRKSALNVGWTLSISMRLWELGITTMTWPRYPSSQKDKSTHPISWKRVPNKDNTGTSITALGSMRMSCFYQ